jgi:hypothetical protein
MANDLKKGINKFFKRILEIESGTSKENAKALKRIRTTLKDNKYMMTKRVRKEITKQFKVIEANSSESLDDIQKIMDEIAIANIAKASRLPDQEAIVRKVVNRVRLDRLSANIHPIIVSVRKRLLSQLKTSIGAGEGAIKAAKKLLAVEDPTVVIPKFIREIEKAARQAITDPREYAAFRKVLKKHKPYIDKLARAGEPGFELLGTRRGTRAFTREVNKLVDRMKDLPADIRAANTGLLDDIVQKWANRKALYQQQVVARTEGSNAYHQYTLKYGQEADHIIGIRVFLSGSHPDNDICDEFASINGTDYFFKDGTPPVPTFHPNCICYTEYIFDEELLKEAA